MKFNSELSYYENRDAWLEHYWDTPHTRYDSLTEVEKAWLRAFNETLRQLEGKYFPILEAKHQELQSRVADSSDWLLEFNLEYVITFYLREDDPEYEEDESNVLTAIEEIVFEHNFRSDFDWGFGAIHVNHVEPSLRFPPEESHCYLYHQLTDHCHLDMRDLFRIGDMYFEIKIDEQSGRLPINSII